MLIAKIPFFQWVVPSFGASRVAKPLHSVEPIEIKSFGTVKEEEIESIVLKMLGNSVDVEDKQYKKDFKDQVLIVNWKIGEISAYQIFEESSYKYEYGKLHDDANLTLVIENLNFAKRFLREDPTNFAPGLDSDDNFVIYVANPLVKMQFKDPKTYSAILPKFPFIGAIYQRTPITEQKEVRENFGGYIPVNIPLGEFENVVVPYQVFESFINKASNIILRTCPCRERGNCQNHAIELGCIFMGDDTFNMAVSEEQAYVATKEQALEHTRKAIDNGLIPLIGRNVEEAEGAGVKDTGHFLSCCFCCTCCCVGAKGVEYGTSAMRGSGGGWFKRIEGLEIKQDSAKCVGCGDCVGVCGAKAREIVEGKAIMDPNLCIGCGRCVIACPNEAISIEIEDPKYIDKFIARIESIVDVENQDTKIDA
jgi:ferredoxin